VTDDKYIETQSCVLAIARLALGLDLSGFIARIDQAEAAGPILDPSLYRDTATLVADLKRMAQDLQPFQATVQEIKDRHLSKRG
jgi:hypothetical protein